MTFTEKPLKYYDGSQWVDVFITGTATSAPFGGHSTLGDGIVAYWKLNSNAYDSTGNGNDGTVYGASPVSEGKINSCYSFDGTDDYLDFGTGVDFSGLKEYTIEYWVKSNEFGSTAMRGFLDTSLSDVIVTYYDDGNIYVNFCGSNEDRNYYSMSAFNDGNWHQLVIRYDGSASTNAERGELWVDGTRQTRGGGRGTIPSSFPSYTPNGMLHGKETGQGRWYDGDLDEVGIWNRALTESEISDLYNEGTGLTY